MANVPNVNFFIGYVNCLEGLSLKNEMVKKYLDERQFYSCNNPKHTYLSYVKEGSQEKIDYISYSGNSEKSHGVFSKNGLLSQEDLKQMKEGLRTTKSVIWHGVVSFTEEFGNKYCDSNDKAMLLMQKELPKFFKNAGLLPNNIEWYAGLHENTDNQHIHFSFYEKKPLRPKERHKKLCYSDGKIPLKAINSVKLSIELKLLDISSNVVKERNEILNIEKQKLNQGVAMKQIKKLVLHLPGTGRLSYDSENIKELRPMIDSIVNLIIQNNKEVSMKFANFSQRIRQRDEEIQKICERMKVDYSDKLLYTKYIQDLYRRLGNQVLYIAKRIKFEERKLEFNTKKRLIQKRIEKHKRKMLIKQCFYLNDLVNREAISFFQDYLHKLSEANYKNLQEQGLV